MIITYSECVFVALCIQREMLMRHIVVCGLFGSTIFFFLANYLINATILEKNKNHRTQNVCFGFLYIICLEHFLYNICTFVHFVQHLSGTFFVQHLYICLFCTTFVWNIFCTIFVHLYILYNICLEHFLYICTFCRAFVWNIFCTTFVHLYILYNFCLKHLLYNICTFVHFV